MQSQPTPISRSVLTAATVVYVGSALVLLLMPSVSSAFGSVYGLFFDVIGWHWMRPSYLDVPANVLLFIPVGLLTTLWSGRFRWGGFGVAVALSAASEFAQLLLPDRDANVRDILSNAIGAALGAGVAFLVLRARHAES